MTRDEALDEAIKALDQRARRARIFSDPTGGQVYQRCVQAIAVLTEMQGSLEILPLFAGQERGE